MSTWNMENHIVGKVYDLTQENMNAIIADLEMTRAMKMFFQRQAEYSSRELDHPTMIRLKIENEKLRAEIGQLESDLSECHKTINNLVDEAYALQTIIKVMEIALRFIRNEMDYRRYQIEGGHEIRMTGEMHTAIQRADEALASLKEYRESHTKEESKERE